METSQIKVKSDVLLSIANDLKKLKNISGFAVITDSKVKSLYGGKLLWNLRHAGLKAEILSFPQGEKSKTFPTVETLSNQMVEKGFDRDSCVIALGGGVVNDLAGFVSSIYMRGIPVIQIPTTLLAMIDSSIGGKTGVNLNSGKNLIGTFHQPLAVFIDPYFLKTLPIKQIRNGLAEAIKYGIIRSRTLFNFIDKNLEKILKLDQKILKRLIENCVKIKTEIVEKDEKEKGIRQILNYGHTFGHAMEKQSNYTLLHGFAISLGMVLANRIAVEKNILKQHDSDCIKNLLKKTGLPVYTMHKPTLKDVQNDKKKHEKSINFILPTRIGEVIIHKIKIT